MRCQLYGTSYLFVKKTLTGQLDMLLQQIERIGYAGSERWLIVETVPLSAPYQIARVWERVDLFAIDLAPDPAYMIRVHMCEENSVDIGRFESRALKI